MGEVPNIKALRAATKDQKDFIMIGINLDRDRAATGAFGCSGQLATIIF